MSGPLSRLGLLRLLRRAVGNDDAAAKIFLVLDVLNEDAITDRFDFELRVRRR